MSRSLGVLFVLGSLATPALADPVVVLPDEGISVTSDAPLVASERPRDVMVWEQPTEPLPPAPPGVAGAAAYNTIFMNRCPSGCVITPGSTSSITDRWNIGSTRTLTAFPYGDAVWASTMSCLRDVFSPFGVNVTDVDPGSANHFEVMIAGAPQDLNMSSGIGGISPFQCGQPYINNSLVFDFAKVWGSGTSCSQGCIEEMCSTAAQEIAHSFTLDHVTLASDPMTYNAFNGRRRYQNVQAQCGSDCVNGQSPFGQACTGQTHACACTGSQTQNSFQTLINLFGAGTPTPPVVKITNPKNGAQVSPGFPVVADVTDDTGITKAELYVDNTLTMTITSAPYAFNAPATLGDGTHRVEVRGYDLQITSGSGMISVIIGKPCGKPSDCPMSTDTCVGGRCVPGPGVQGGLGQPCMKGTDCASGQCASDGTNSYCVEQCDLGKGQCPSSFGCLDTGNMNGVCWPGFDDGTGGICAAGSRGGPITLGLSFAALVFTRRRRRR
jgi:uncharacterized protein (TIGR03382 family)